VPAPWQKPRTENWEPFYVASPGSIRFTLWWADTDAKPSPQPGPDALRIKVLASAHRDYVTLSFYLDAAKPWDRPPIAAGEAPVGIAARKSSTTSLASVPSAKRVWWRIPRASARLIARSCPSTR
jgi:hypothetical protein